MAKYSPKSRDELVELISDESVNLGDIDTSAIDDMSCLFEDSERTDFNGIEKWDISNVENIGSAFEGVYLNDISAICKQLKIKETYIVKVDEDNQIQEVLEKYHDRLQATWELKDRYENGDLDDDKEFFAVIGYEPNEITIDDLEPLVGMDMIEADWLLRNGIRKAIAFDNVDGISDGGTIGKIFGVYATRLEAIEQFSNGNCSDEWFDFITGDLQSLGYQPKFDIETFVGKDYLLLAEALRWVEWLNWNECYWWVEVIMDSGEIIRVVQKFDDWDEAEAYKTKLPKAKEGNAYVLLGNAGEWLAGEWSDEADKELSLSEFLERENIQKINGKYKPNNEQQLKILVQNNELNLGDIDTSAITDMSNLFNCSEREDFSGIENWDTSNVTNMKCMFFCAKSFNQPLDKWDTSNVTDMSGMFWRTSNFNQPLNSWNVSKVENMACIFKEASNFNQSLDKWDTSNVTDMRMAFESASSFNQHLNDWNVENVSDMRFMFQGASNFNQPLNSWNVSKVENMIDMFDNCPIQDNLPDWYNDESDDDK